MARFTGFNIYEYLYVIKTQISDFVFLSNFLFELLLEAIPYLLVDFFFSFSEEQSWKKDTILGYLQLLGNIQLCSMPEMIYSLKLINLEAIGFSWPTGDRFHPLVTGKGASEEKLKYMNIEN